MDEVLFGEGAGDETFINTYRELEPGHDKNSKYSPRAAPIIPKDNTCFGSDLLQAKGALRLTANHSRQFKTSLGSSPLLILKIFCGLPPPPAMMKS